MAQLGRVEGEGLRGVGGVGPISKPPCHGSQGGALSIVHGSPHADKGAFVGVFEVTARALKIRYRLVVT